MGVGSRGERRLSAAWSSFKRRGGGAGCPASAPPPLPPGLRPEPTLGGQPLSSHSGKSRWLVPGADQQLTSFLAILLYLNGEVAEGEAVLNSLNPAKVMLCYFVGNLVVCMHSTEKHMVHFH